MRRILSRCWPALGVALALAAYWWMAASVSPRVGVTADELGHLTAGYSYWQWHDYRLNPENGTLPARVATLPWLLSPPRLPPANGDAWQAANIDQFGQRFFYGLGNPWERMLGQARAALAIFGVVTVWLTWAWARGLFGAAAGWVALGLAVFCPALLAHGGLATSDMALTACVFGALTLVWRTLHRITLPRLVGAAGACGLAFLAKASGVLIVPVIAALLIARWWRRAPLVLAFGRRELWVRSRARIAAATFAATLLIAAGSLTVLWAGYGFRYSGFNQAVSPGGQYHFSWEVVLGEKPLPWPETSALDPLGPARPPPERTALAGIVAWMRDHRVLPEPYLWGLAHTDRFSRYRPAFFLGEVRTTGWAFFFPVAFLLKTTLPALGLIAVGAGALAWTTRRRTVPRLRWPYRAAPLIVFFALYWLMALRLPLNIGHRHLLPTYPVFYVIASGAALALATAGRRAILGGLAAALALHAVDSLAARPFYLAYFQPLTGGTARGYHYLLDSSFDWGQGLPDLRAWLARQRQAGDRAPVFLTYCGVDSPRARGLAVVRFGDESSDWGERVFPAAVRGGWFVVSANHLRRIYLPTRGPWTPRHEQLYRDVQARLGVAATRKTPRTPAEDDQLRQDVKDYEALQFGRLSHILERREPHAVIGASLLAFRLTDAEVNAALHGPPPFD